MSCGTTLGSLQPRQESVSRMCRQNEISASADTGLGPSDGSSEPARPRGPLVPASNPPSEEELDLLRQQSLLLEDATPAEIIAWAVRTYHPRLTMATAFGPEGCLILSMLAGIEPAVYVFNLETGYQFQETLELRERIAEKYGIVVDYQRAEQSVAEYEAANGGPVYNTDSDRCCKERKIDVLHRVSRGFDAWMSGIRRDQSPHRAGAPIVGWDKRFGLVKISPLANWTKKQVWQRIAADGVPYNPLHDKGFPSVGCWPCTRSVLQGDDERAGRWSGSEKTECGLHSSD